MFHLLLFHPLVRKLWLLDERNTSNNDDNNTERGDPSQIPKGSLCVK
jgi:hypothetical protein